MQQMKNSGVKIIVLALPTGSMKHVYAAAKSLGMLTDAYTFITAPEYVPDYAGKGFPGVFYPRLQPLSNSSEYNLLQPIWMANYLANKDFPGTLLFDPFKGMANASITGMYAYDAVLTLALAMEKIILNNGNILNSTLVRLYIKNSSFIGATGLVKLDVFYTNIGKSRRFGCL